jgi:ATP-dependent Lon protease
MNGTASIRARRKIPLGMAANLAQTANGGKVVYIEAVLLPGGAGITITGQTGEEMEDRVRVARGHVWSRAAELGIHQRLFRRYGLHVHAPTGEAEHAAAGLALAVALVSLYSGCSVEPDVAITGEITLTGLVLPVVGINERIAAARSGGFEKIILPRDNQKNIEECPARDREGLSLIFADNVQDALNAALPRLMKQLAALKPSL